MENQNTNISGGGAATALKGLINFSWLIERVRKILVSPNEAWQIIKAESTSIPDIYKNFLLPMVAITPLCTWLGDLFSGYGTFFGGLTTAIISYVLELALLMVLAFIMEKFTSFFEGTTNQLDAFKLAAYSCTPGFVAGFFALIRTKFFFLLTVVMSLYSLYVFYLGISVMTTVPESKRLPYMTFVFLAAILIGVLFWSVLIGLA